MSKQSSWRRRTGAVLAAGLLLGPLGQFAHAEGKDIQLQVVVGFESAFRETALTSVQVTVENKGDDFTGRLVVKPKYDNQGQFIASNFVKDVVIPKNATKKLTMEVPGGLFREAVDVQLVDQGGKEVDVASPGTSNINDGMLLGGIAQSKDDLNLFTLVTSPAVGGKVTLRKLDAADLPEQSDVYGALDLLVVNHAPQDKISPEQIQAIKTWVENGGKLLLSGGANYSGGGSLFADLSPVQVTGTTEVTDLSALGAFAGTKPNTAKLTVSTGKLAPGATALVQAGDVPLLAERSVGAGKVLYAAYDFGEEPLASWQGNKDLWGKVFARANFQVMSLNQSQMNGGPQGIEQRRELVNTSQMFSQIVPSFTKNVAVFVGYMIVVGPLMFFVLRRTKKQAWGWGLIPGVAVVLAVGVYLVGSSSQSGGAIGQFVSVIDLKSKETAKVQGAGSFVVTVGGDYAVNLPKSAYGFSASGYTPAESRGLSSVIVGDEGQRIEYRNVEYWTLRSASIEGTLKDMGLVKSDLRVNKDGKLVGTLTNESKFDFTSVYLLVGNEPIKLAEMKTGGTLQVDQALLKTAGTNNMSLYGAISERMFPYPMGGTPFGGEDQQTQQFRSLANYATAPWNIGTASVQLLAYTHTPVDLYQIENVKMSDSAYTSLVRQELSLTYDGNGASMPPGFIRPQVTAQEGQAYMAPEGMRLMIGSVTLEYSLKSNANFAIEQVKTNLDQASYAMFEKHLFNYQTGQWEQVTKDNTPTISGADLNKFVSPDGVLKVRFKSSSAQDQFLPYPNVGVEGKVNG
ncbi:MAG: hypothetical protein WCC10_01600 [Tumebacillaceae bacterium]